MLFRVISRNFVVPIIIEIISPLYPRSSELCFFGGASFCWEKEIETAQGVKVTKGKLKKSFKTASEKAFTVDTYSIM